jgi:sphingomyelin phosphodiesterase
MNIFWLWLTILHIIKAQNIGTFIQLTDIHYDSYYTPGAYSTCLLGDTGLGCCRKDSIPISPYTKASIWGDYNCDMPFMFINESLNWININVAKPDFVLWNGDSVDHHDIEQSFNNNMDELSTITKLIQTYFSNSKIYPNIGNHDTYPIDQLWYEFSETELSKYLSNLWKDYVTDDFNIGGYYYVFLNKNTILININSLLYDTHNIFIYQVPDPSNQKKWIIDTLEYARDNNLQVWISGHIPIMANECSTNFTDFMIDTSIYYSDVIKYQFWGHTHQDYFYLIKDQYNISKSLSFVAPSIMADQRFSSFREYYYDRDTMNIISYNHYHANLTKIINQNYVSYELAYNTLTNYNITNLDIKNYDIFYNNLSNNTNLLLDLYYNYNPGNVNNINCDQYCQLELLNQLIYK